MTGGDGEVTTAALLDQRLIVCLGSGGVGKTTMAAALALTIANQGRRCAVITVDPARRLRDAFGLAALSGTPQKVDAVAGDGELHAMALDAKHTFDALIDRATPDAETARRIRENRIYQAMSQEVGGSVEFMAMEKLYELEVGGAYDCIVVDTAPSAHARDLLGAPSRIANLAASSAVRILKSPLTLLEGAGIAAMPLRALLAALERWTGLTLLEDLADFAAGFEPMAGGFAERAAAIEGILRAAATSFVLVTTPEADTARATLRLAAEIRRDALPLAGAIVNRVYEFPPRPAVAPLRCDDALMHKLDNNYRDFDALSRRDERTVERMREDLDAPLLALVPALRDPVSSLSQLQQLALLLAERLQ